MALESTKGIILQKIKYSDTSVISQIYTEKFGRKSFLFKGIRSGKSKIHANLLQPLFILNIVAYIKEKNELCLVKEANLFTSFTSLPFDIKKGTQAIFIAEILTKCLREEESNPLLFSFLQNSFEYFDLVESGSANFHLLFLIKLSKHLGYYPQLLPESREVIFDVKELFSGHTEIAGHEIYELLEKIIHLNYNELHNLELNQQKRNQLLDFILMFYSMHIEGMKKIKSYPILKELFL
jgi:DNA repair protein RecO (recombination protein O)